MLCPISVFVKMMRCFIVRSHKVSSFGYALWICPAETHLPGFCELHHLVFCGHLQSQFLLHLSPLSATNMFASLQANVKSNSGWFWWGIKLQYGSRLSPVTALRKWQVGSYWDVVLMNRSVILLFYFLWIYFLLDIIIFHTEECLYD